MNYIKIDLERVISDIDRNIFGGFLEVKHQDTRFEYLDIGDSHDADKGRIRGDIREAIERVKLSNIRFPGGNFVSGYRWRDGVGPREERPIRHDLAWNCIVSNQYGTNEFMRFCKAMNIEPYMVVNCGDGDMREAADWVEYCNGTSESALANLRRKHGFTEPYKVKYWGIGNEVDSPHQIGYKTPQEYARAVTEFSKVMKWTDPNIKIIASGICSWQDKPLSPQFLYKETEWVERTQLMLEQAGDRIDYIAIHRYADAFGDDPFENYMAFGENLNEHLSALEGLIHAVSLERGIKHNIGITIDEWIAARVPSDLYVETPILVTVDEHGVTHLPDNERKIIRQHQERKRTLEDALVIGLFLNAFIRHSHSVRMANFCVPLPMSMGLSTEHPEKPVLLPTIYYPFELYSRTCGQQALDIFWKGDTFSGTYKDHSYIGLRTLDVTATLDNTNKQLVVYVVNQSKAEAMETTISLVSGEFTGSMRAYVINGSDINDANTEEKPEQVSIQETTHKASGKSFKFNFEPHSVTALVCPVS